MVIVKLALCIFAMTWCRCAFAFKNSSGGKKHVAHRNILFMNRGYNDRSRFLSRKKEKRVEVFQEKVIPDLEKIVEEADSEDFSPGSLLRRKRNRNLKELNQDQKISMKSSVGFQTVPQSKRSESNVAQILQCLSLSTKSSTKNNVDLEVIDLSKYRELLNLIDWDKFHAAAREDIPNYEEGNNKSIVYNWVFFHIKKGDIEFSGGDWLWNPRNVKKRRR